MPAKPLFDPQPSDPRPGRNFEAKWVLNWTAVWDDIIGNDPKGITSLDHSHTPVTPRDVPPLASRMDMPTTSMRPSPEDALSDFHESYGDFYEETTKEEAVSLYLNDKEEGSRRSSSCV